MEQPDGSSAPRRDRRVAVPTHRNREAARSTCASSCLLRDGAVLAQSETRLNIAGDPAEARTVSTGASSSFEPTARAEAPKPGEALPPRPERKPGAKIRTFGGRSAKVKVVTIKPPGPTRPHGRRFRVGRGSGKLRRSGREIVSPVDMHARPQQSSETVKVMERVSSSASPRGIKELGGTQRPSHVRGERLGLFALPSSRANRPRNSFWGFISCRRQGGGHHASPLSRAVAEFRARARELAGSFSRSLEGCL